MSFFALFKSLYLQCTISKYSGKISNKFRGILFNTWFLVQIINYRIQVSGITAIIFSTIDTSQSAVKSMFFAAATLIFTVWHTRTSYQFQQFCRSWWLICVNRDISCIVSLPTPCLRLHVNVVAFPNTDLIIDSETIILGRCWSGW